MALLEYFRKRARTSTSESSILVVDPVVLPDENGLLSKEVLLSKKPMRKFLKLYKQQGSISHI